MESVNILDARNHLSRLVAAASDGEDVVIAKRGRPIVRLVAITEDDERRTAARAAVWLTREHPPGSAVRDRADLEARLDARIDAEREGWE